ncbi:MAG: helix-turn-helix domain-containing protein [Magnetococcales bacterium]|nr:helix-turn-helix domain-containing protein [Magnetococcales bacterium]
MENFLGQKLRELRKKKKLSLDKVAKMTGSAKSYLWELEQGRIPQPSVVKIQKLAETYDVTASFLMDPRISEPIENEQDMAFYRKYQNLPADTKKKIRELVEIWDRE